MHYRFKKRHLRLGFPVLDGTTAPLSAVWRARPRGVPHRVLVVRLDHLGDAVLTTAMLAPMRRAWPHATLDVLGSPWNVEVFRHNPHVDRVWSLAGNWFDRSGPTPGVWRRNRELLGQLRERCYDVALDPRGDARIAMVMLACGIPQRVGYSGGGGAALLTWPVDWPPQAHEADRCLALVRELGIAADVARPYLEPTPMDRESAARLLAEHALAPDAPRAIVHVGAGTPAKRWPSDRYAAVVAEVTTLVDGPVLLVGAEAEAKEAEIVRGMAGGRTVNLAGRTDFGQLAALVQGARIMVGCDSGPTHVAAALAAPTVVLFSGTTSPAEFRPIGPRVRTVHHPAPCAPCERLDCPRPGHPCMTGIQVDAVLRAIHDVL